MISIRNTQNQLLANAGKRFFQIAQKHVVKRIRDIWQHYNYIAGPLCPHSARKPVYLITELLYGRLHSASSFFADIPTIYYIRYSSDGYTGIKSFFHFLTVADYLKTDPSELLEGPKIGFKIPEVLTVEEIDRIISAVDMDKKEGQRNRAILETLYSCGLRVSELCNLKLSDLYFEEGFIKVEGKGSKQRLVPISPRAIKEIKYWLTDRSLGKIKKGYEDYVFLARWGNNISRIMVFHMIKELAEKTGITKNISPHTFRHSFATHLLEGGANLRAIQCMLGHESIATTEIYTHIDRNMLRSEIIEHHPRNIKYRKERGIY